MRRLGYVMEGEYLPGRDRTGLATSWKVSIFHRGEEMRWLGYVMEGEYLP
jgi:hypothetical protein